MIKCSVLYYCTCVWKLAKNAQIKIRTSLLGVLTGQNVYSVNKEVRLVVWCCDIGKIQYVE